VKGAGVKGLDEIAERAPDAAWRALQLSDARDSFADFCALIDIPQAPLKDEADDPDGDDEAEPDPLPAAAREDAAHLVLLQATLQRLERGEITRLMVFMPPGGAKSSYVSVCFPPWFMGRRRRRNVILATYAAGLGRKLGRRARSILRQPVYQEVFGVGLSPQISAADEWALTNDNEFMAVGVRAGVTGNRADLIIVDDPIKGREEAESKLIRDKTWDEWRDSIRTRLKPGGRIVIVQTRWHEDDLAGRILPEDYDGATGWVDGRDGEPWYVVCIPAEADRADDPLGRRIGELFWPQWFPAAHWIPFRQDPRTWASLCQQKPRPDEGSFFKRSWFHRFRLQDLPASVRFYVTSDYATKAGAGDYTVHAVWAVDAGLDVWLVDVWREQGTTDLWIEALIDLVLEHRARGCGPVRCIGEKGVIFNAIAPMLKRRMSERKALFRTELMSSQGGDKAERARGFQALAREGRVHVIDDMAGDVFLEELAAFPAGKHDDQVDAAALIGRAFDRLRGGVGKDSRPSGYDVDDTWG
jgi:predicted phage terminase large subunit-like protein